MAKIQLKRGTQAQVLAAPLSSGEPAFALDTFAVFVADGSNNKYLVGRAFIDTFANRPAASIPGRLFFASDTTTLYIDNGSTWTAISGGGGSGDAIVLASQTVDGGVATGDPIYFDGSSWKKATLSTDRPTAVKSGTAGEVVLGGKAAGLTGLVAGTEYYLATSGGLTSEVTDTFIGTALSTTTIGVGIDKIGVAAQSSALYEIQTAAAGQTVFTLLQGSYTVGGKSLLVFQNGKKLIPIVEYAETSASSITLTSGAVLDDKLEFIVPSAAEGEGFGRDDFTATSGDTTFTASNAAPITATNCIVVSGGILMYYGASADYTISNNNVVFTSGRSQDEKVSIIRIAGANAEENGGIINYQKLNPTASQQTFNLDFAYVTGSNRLQMLVNGVKQILTDDYVETDSTTVTYNTADLIATDVVEFIYYGAASTLDAAPPAPSVFEKYVATAGQTEFELISPYQVGANALRVFRNGLHQISGSDYTETDAKTVTFSTALTAGEEVVFLQMGESGTNLVSARQEFTAASGDTVFDLNFSYATNANELFVWSSGVLMAPGSDYTESSPTQITFVSGRSAGEKIVVARIGANTASAMKLWEKHLATASQTVFTLLGSYNPGTYSLQVFRNGQLLAVTDDYAETNSNTVTLTFTPVLDDKFIFMVAGGETLAQADSGVLVRELYTATASQTVFNLGMTYTVGGYGLMVIRNGQVQVAGVDYTETGQSQVTFTSGLTAGDQVEFKNFAKVAANQDGVLNRAFFDAADGDVVVGQTAIDLPFRYNPGSNMLVVIRNGLWQVVGDDYTETDADTVTLATSIQNTSEKLIFYTIAQAKAGSRAHTVSYHDDGALAIKSTFHKMKIISNTGTAGINESIVYGGAIVGSDDGTTLIEVPSSGLTLDISSSGANGLDTGTVSATTLYYVWLIYNPTTATTAGLYSLSTTSPTLPSGYTKKRLVGAVRYDSTSFKESQQVDNRFSYLSNFVVLSSGAATSWTAIDCSAWIPSLAEVGAFDLSGWTVTSGSSTHYTSPDNAGYFTLGTTVFGGSYYGNSVEMPCPSQTIYYLNSVANGRLSIFVHGFVLDI